MLEAVEGRLCLLEVLEVPEVMRHVLLCMLEAVEGELWLSKVLELPEEIRCVLFCMLEAVNGGFCLLETLEVLEVLELMRHVLLCMLEAVEGHHGHNQMVTGKLPIPRAFVTDSQISFMVNLSLTSLEA